jgi:hypothetical protein
MFRWNDDATDDAKQAVADGLAGLPAVIPEIRRYEFGPDLALREGNWDFVVIADFDDTEAYEAYSAAATHQALIAEHIVPNIAQRAAVQHEVRG